MTITGKTRVCGVIGEPIEHTLSPLMHNAAFEALKLDYVFLAFRVKPAEVENAVNGMRALNIRGFNVTMPHKNAVIKYLDELDPTAEFIKAVNTDLAKSLTTKIRLTGAQIASGGVMEMVTADSPTQRAGARPADRFEKVRHPAPILSLANAFGADDARGWFERVQRIDDRVERAKFVVEPKIDGLSVVLHYRDGIFVQGATRGNGEIGEDITVNLRTVRSIPLRIPVDEKGPKPPKVLVVRGEAFLPIKEFEKLNQQRVEEGLPAYLNPRNTAAGSLRVSRL